MSGRLEIVGPTNMPLPFVLFLTRLYVSVSVPA